MPFLWFRRKKKSKKNQSAEEGDSQRNPPNIQNGVTGEDENYINTLIDPTQDSKPYSESAMSTSTNVDMFRLGLEVAKPFTPWIESVTKIIEEIISIFENAQYNQKTCLVLVERVEAITPSVKKLSRHKEENEHKFRNQEYFNAFIRFHKILQQIKEFVNDVSQLKGYRKYTHANDVKGRCQFLITEFEKCCRDLQFNILISKEDRDKEEEYLENDVIAMKKFLEASGQLENQDRIKLDLVFDEISEMHKKMHEKMKKIMNNNEDELLNAPQIPGNELSDPEIMISRNKVYKQMLRQVVPVACKPVIIPDNSSKEALKIKGQLAILGRLYSSNHIIKFHGVSTINGQKNIVLDWADHGSLRKVYEENSQVLNWHVKLRIAHEICNGLVFLQACGIFHHDIRCENILVTGGDKYEAKIANFYLSRDTSQMSHGIPNLATIVRWLAPEKMPKGKNPIKEPYTFKCEIFSFGMLLWELAFERFPYKNMGMPEITEHVLNKKRETLNFPTDTPSEIITGFNNIIVASWNHDPQSRPVIKDLFNDFTMLVNNHSKNSSGFEFITQTVSHSKSSPEITVTVEENIEDIDDLYITALPPSLKPIIPLEEGINAHRNAEREKAWECFEIHAHLGDPKAKYWMGYYLWEGYHKPKDQEKAKRLFKDAADAGVADAQLRYAFAISKENVKDFIKYLIKAADSGNATAQYNMADMYLKGRLGVEMDEKKGLQYLRLAALKNQPKAIEALKHYDVNAIYV